jgi:hypothetical protein
VRGLVALEEPGASRRRRAIAAFLLVLGGPVPVALAAEWDALRDRQREAVGAAAGRVPDVAALARAAPADREALADRITRDRIAQIKASATASGEGWPSAPDAAATDRVGAAIRRWETAGPERRGAAASLATVERDFHAANEHLTAAIEAVDAMANRLEQSGLRAALTQIEPEAGEANSRLAARWQREHEARERERLQREREAGQRERGVR